MRAARSVQHRQLIEQHGVDAKLTDLLAVLTENCPKARHVSVYERCRAVYEGLSVSERRL